MPMRTPTFPVAVALGTALLGCANPLPGTDTESTTAVDTGTTSSPTPSTSSIDSSPSTGPDDTTYSTGQPTAGETESEDLPPLARNDGPYVTVTGQPLDVDARTGVLANDEDPEGGTLAVMSHEPATVEGGSVTVNEDGSFSYMPPATLPFGTDRFHYTLVDPSGQSAVAEVRLVLQPPQGIVGLDALGPKGVRLSGIDPDDRAGYTVSGTSDVDHDGYADILVAAFDADPGGVTDAGETYWVRGGPNLPSIVPLTTADARFDGIATNDNAGWALGEAGDVNGDGHADILVGSWNAAPDGIAYAGETYLVYGADTLPSSLSLAQADVRFSGLATGDEVSGAGDVNGDGYSDLLLGAYGADSAGDVFLILGGSDLPATLDLADADTRFIGQDPSNFGFQVAGVGDVNGDRLDDILIGAPGADPFGLSIAGSASLIYGSTNLSPTYDVAQADVRIDGTELYGYLGFSTSGAGDVNGDGHADLLLGLPQSSPNGLTSAGSACVFLGGPALPPVMVTENAEVCLEGIEPGNWTGYGVAGAGDVNGDGYADVLVGLECYNLDGECTGDRGEGYLVLGGPDLPPTIDLADADLRLQGIDPGDDAGFSVSRARDVDGDGFDDMLIGAPNHAGTGEAYLVRGDDLSGTVTLLGTADDDMLEATHGLDTDIIVAGRGDDILRGDGGPDVLRGGGGSDTVIIASDDFFRIDGGLGEDTIELAGGTSLSLPSLDAQRILGIERIELGLDGACSLQLSERSVVNLSDTSNTLTVDGDEDDEVVIVSGSWTGPVLEDGYDVYASTTTAAVVRVAPNVTVTQP